MYFEFIKLLHDDQIIHTIEHIIKTYTITIAHSKTPYITLDYNTILCQLPDYYDTQKYPRHYFIQIQEHF